MKIMWYCILCIVVGASSFVFSATGQTNLEPKEVTNLLSITNNQLKYISLSNGANPYYFSYNKEVARSLIEERDSVVVLRIPIDNDTSWTLNLKEVPDSFYDYVITTASGKRYELNNRSIIHYRGIVHGQENTSMVAISIFENEMMGVISTQKDGNFDIGILEDRSMHVMYSSKNLNSPPLFDCDTKLDEADFENKEIINSTTDKNNILVKNCMEIYMEVDYQLYQFKGNDASTINNFVSGMFNQAAILYANEGLSMKLSEIKIWDIPDPYNNSIDRKYVLGQLINHLNGTMNGDLGHLIAYRPDNQGGRAAGFDGLCKSGIDKSVSLSLISDYYNLFPIYSPSVYLLAHELGHLLSSLHTHDCVWNGNNTAIDECAGSYCSNSPGLPPEGGTVMSYCQNTIVGMNFSLGFGPQPGDRIRSYVNKNSWCLDYCCPSYLTITEDVTSGDTDFRNANEAIEVNNDIHPGSIAHYGAGNNVILSLGFHAHEGSSFRIYNGACPKDLDQEMISGSIENKENVESSVTIIPNPTNGLFHIYIKEEENYSVSIIDVTGKVLYSNSEYSNKTPIDMSDYLDGIYFVITTNGGQSVTKRLVKM